jgi:hypothetical protein
MEELGRDLGPDPRTKGMEELPIDQVPILKFCKTSLDPYKKLSTWNY